MFSKSAKVVFWLATSMLLGCGGDDGPGLEFIDVNEGFYKFDETAGAVATDSLAAGFHGTIVGAQRVQGKIGNALNFAQLNSSHVDLPVMCCFGKSVDMEFLADRIFIEAWLFFDSLDVASSYPIFGNPQSNDSFRLFIDNGKLNFALFSRGAGSGEVNIISSNTIFSTNTWYHFAVMHDGSNAVIYINGVEDNTNSIVHPVHNVLNNLYIGGNGSTSFPGIIDEFHFSTTLKTAQQINSYYEQNK